MDTYYVNVCIYIYIDIDTLVKNNLLQNIYIYIYIYIYLQYVSFQDILLNRANIAAEILHVHGVILILT